MFPGYVSRCGSDSDNSSDMDMEPLVSLVSVDVKPRPRVRSSSDPQERKRKDRDRRRNRDGKETQPWAGKKEKEEKDADTEKQVYLQDKIEEAVNEDGQLGEDTARAQNDGATQIEPTDKDSGDQLKKTGAQKEAHECKTGGGGEFRAADDQPSVSEPSDSCHTDSRVLNSPSCDSLDALEEDDLISCSSSSIHPNAPAQTHDHFHSPLQLQTYQTRHSQAHLLAPPPAHSHPLIHLTTQDRGGGAYRRSGDGADPQLLAPVSPYADIHLINKCWGNNYSDDSSLCFAELNRLVDFLPSPPEASEDDEDEEEELRRRRRKVLEEKDEFMRRVSEGGSSCREGSFKSSLLSPSLSPPSSHMEFIFNFDQSDARCYYKLCSSITPDSARSLPHLLNHDEVEEGGEVEMEGDHAGAVEMKLVPILQPPPGFGDSSSDDEFFDASDRFTSPEDPTSGTVPRGDSVFIMRLSFSLCR